MPLSNNSRERLQVMRATTDGFLIAEKDLELRGSGDFLGTQQTGYNKYKVADLKRDKDLLPMVAKTAGLLINSDPITSKAIAKRWLGDFEAFIIS
jgi:ATP-dependent DNA helicase RecG